MRRPIVLAAVWILLGVPVVLFLGFLGVPPVFGAAWILVFAAALLIARQSFLDEDGPWPPPPPQPLQRGSEAARLAWSIDTRTGMVGPSLRRRITALAERRLREHGLPPETADPAGVDAVLGAGAHAALTGPVLRREDLESLLRALEQPLVPSTQESP
ncbi:hypothetical protein NFX31_07050 [Microbacterium azadirachtae]|uniref:hypothetical protein n=1 Tax=Microbacterium azadirachtae TaxID=582680 RepID=UPI0021D48C43|nr:hypothetical protein [Microbacterium azadirachtae]UXW87264.1 hypothetical protein NFX31_07050 [Microbacterium azadirachtae]